MQRVDFLPTYIHTKKSAHIHVILYAKITNNAILTSTNSFTLMLGLVKIISISVNQIMNSY